MRAREILLDAIANWRFVVGGEINAFVGRIGEFGEFGARKTDDEVALHGLDLMSAVRSDGGKPIQSPDFDAFRDDFAALQTFQLGGRDAKADAVF